MIFAIASYKRPECKAVKTLLKAGIKSEDIVISVQDENDILPYEKNNPNIRIIYKKSDCAAGNRNTLLEEIKERPICLMDDDVVSFGIYENKGFKVNTLKFLNSLEDMVNQAQRNGCSLAGVAPNNSNIIAKSRQSVSIDVLLQGSFLIVMDDAKFDENFKMVEDYEISLKQIFRGNHTIRFNHVVANKPKNGTNEGGLHERYLNGELPKWINFLELVYPMFKANKQKTGGDIKWI